jgi:hypothetical protein
MINISEFRQTYPEYDDLSDDALLGKLHSAYYSDIPYAEFRSQVQTGRPVPSMAPPKAEVAQPSGSYSPSAVAGEFASAANRNLMDTVDFLGPGSVNAGLRLLGAEGYQLPEFGQLYRQFAPGAEGGFMPPGLLRDVVRGAGSAAPAAGTLVPAAARNLGTLRGAAAELLGMGSASPARPGIEPVDEYVRSLLRDSGVSPEQVPMAARADEIGFPISPGERAGSETLRRLEGAIESTPMLLNPMHRQAAARQKMMNEVAAEAVGLHKKTPLTDDVVGDVAAELSGEFRRLDDLDALTGTDEFTEELVRIQDAAQSRIFTDENIEDAINKIFDKIDVSGGMSVSDYQDISSELKAKVRLAWKGDSPDPYFAETLSESIDALDNLAVDSASPADLERLKVARKRWRALSQLEKSRSLKESGDVSAPLLANYLRRTDKSGYGRGRNRSPLYETARLSKAFPRGPDSGTASNQFLNRLMADPMGAITTAALLSPASALANAYHAGGLVLPKSARAAASAPGLLARAGSLFEDDNEDRPPYRPPGLLTGRR